MAIYSEFSIKNGDFPWFFVCLPEGTLVFAEFADPPNSFREDFDLFAGLQAQFLTSGRKKDGTVGTIFGSQLWVDRRKG